MNSSNYDTTESGVYLQNEKLNNKLLDQIDQADDIMKDKVKVGSFMKDNRVFIPKNS